MAEAAQSKKGKPRSAGKHKSKYIGYYTLTMPKKKLRALLKHNGELEAYKWAIAKQTLGTLKQLAPKLDFVEMQRKLNKEQACTSPA